MRATGGLAHNAALQTVTGPAQGNFFLLNLLLWRHLVSDLRVVAARSICEFLWVARNMSGVSKGSSPGCAGNKGYNKRTEGGEEGGMERRRDGRLAAASLNHQKVNRSAGRARGKKERMK